MHGSAAVHTVAGGYERLRRSEGVPAPTAILCTSSESSDGRAAKQAVTRAVSIPRSQLQLQLHYVVLRTGLQTTVLLSRRRAVTRAREVSIGLFCEHFSRLGTTPRVHYRSWYVVKLSWSHAIRAPVVSHGVHMHEHRGAQFFCSHDHLSRPLADALRTRTPQLTTGAAAPRP